MYGFLTDAVENVLDVGNDFLEGKSPTKRQVAKLVDAGVSIYAISELTGLGVDVIKSMIDD